MKVNLTNRQIFDIVYSLKANYPDLTKYDKRFNFAVSRTLSNIQPIASELVKSRESSVQEYREFESKKIETIKKYASSVNDNIPVFPSDEVKLECQNEVMKLVEKFKSAIEEREKEIEIYNEILKEEVEVDIIQCRFEALPTNFNFDVLRVLVKESDEEIEELL